MLEQKTHQTGLDTVSSCPCPYQEVSLSIEMAVNMLQKMLTEEKCCQPGTKEPHITCLVFSEQRNSPSPLPMDCSCKYYLQIWLQLNESIVSFSGICKGYLLLSKRSSRLGFLSNMVTLPFSWMHQPNHF